MAKDLFDKMSMFTSRNDDNPFDDIPSSKNIDVNTKITKSKRNEREYYGGDNDTLDRLEKLNEKFENTNAKLCDNDFELVLDSLNDYDEDGDLRDEVIVSGRKYARDFASSSDNSEITKAFAPMVSKLDTIYKSIAREASAVEEDISRMRTNRSIRPTQLAELINTKTSCYNTQLNIVKAMNDVTKTQIELRNKANSVKESDPNGGAQALMQSLFGMDRGSMLSTVDRDDDEPDIRNVIDDTDIYSDDDSQSYDSDDDGDKFLKYENAGVRMVLEEFQDSSKVIYAEDRNGNRLHDYPIPKDVDDLKFEVNERAGTAYDQLQRKYEYRSNY